MGEPVLIAHTKSTRGVGFPKMIQNHGQIYLVWSKAGNTKYASAGLKMLSVPLQKIPPVENKTKSFKQKEHALGIDEFIPEIKLTSYFAKESKIAEYRGNLVLLNYWASWCQPCLAEFSYLREIAKKYNKTKVFAINLEEKMNSPIVQRLSKQYKMSNLFYYDSGGTSRGIFSVNALPYTALLGPLGKVIWTSAGSLLDQKANLTKILKRYEHNK